MRKVDFYRVLRWPFSY